MAKPLKPTAIVKNAIATTGDFANATTRRNTASRPKPIIVFYKNYQDNL
jgi:hypothetical protein